MPTQYELRREYFLEYWNKPRNKTRKNERERIRCKKNPETRSTTSLRLKILDFLGNKCKKCGFKDKRALQIDRKKGGDSKFTRKLGNKYQVYKHYLKNPLKSKKEIQILCANCNWIKRYENKEMYRS